MFYYERAQAVKNFLGAAHFRRAQGKYLDLILWRKAKSIFRRFHSLVTSMLPVILARHYAACGIFPLVSMIGLLFGLGLMILFLVGSSYPERRPPLIIFSVLDTCVVDRPKEATHDRLKEPGGKAEYSIRKARKNGIDLNWPARETPKHMDPDNNIFSDEIEQHYGLLTPIAVYSLMETARRAASDSRKHRR